MSTSEGTQIRHLFGGLLTHFSNKGAGTSTAPAQQETLSKPAELLDGVLAELQKRKDELRKDKIPKGQAVDSANTFSAEDLQKSIELIHKQIASEILDLHQKLGTNLSEATLESSQSLLRELEELVSGMQGSGFESRLRAAVVKNVLARTAKIAWSSLQLLMERTKVTWPAATGLPPWAEEREVTAASERMVSELAEAFYNSSPGRVADRMFGIVTVWKANYPETNSPQRQALALQGVGYGILAYIMREATMELRHGANDVKAKAMSMIASEAQSVQKAFDSGVTAPQDIDQILEQVSGLCEEIIPELAWKSVAAKIDDAVKSVTS